MRTLATFSTPEEAHLLRMRLEAGGVAAYVQDEMTVQLDWLLSNVIGGVRVQVADEDLPAARELLAEDSGIPDYAPEQACPRCRWAGVEREKFSRRLAFFSLILFHFPVLWLVDQWRCSRCLHTWPVEESDCREV
jgi:hypothetical protein